MPAFSTPVAAATCPSRPTPWRGGRYCVKMNSACSSFHVRVARCSRVIPQTSPGTNRREVVAVVAALHLKRNSEEKDEENRPADLVRRSSGRHITDGQSSGARLPLFKAWGILREVDVLLLLHRLWEGVSSKAIVCAAMILLTAYPSVSPAFASTPPSLPATPPAAMLPSSSKIPLKSVDSAVIVAPSQETAAEMSKAMDDLSSEERSTIGLFERCKSSVVYITNVGLRQNNVTLDMEQVPRGTGSGFVWDNKGHIVTNYHVVQGASDLRVALIDQNVYRAKVVSSEPEKDVAVLELDAPADVISSLSPVTLGKSSNLQVGQSVFAIGNPFGLDHTLTSGIISGLGREIGGPRGLPIRGVIQTDAAINPGNSGGVLLDSRGRLIGINTAIADPTGAGSSSGVGFAIPIDTAKGLVDQILQYGQVIRPGLGVTIAPTQLTRQIGADGVLILDVRPKGPAAKAGLKPTYRDEYGRIVLGDIIVELNGEKVRNELDLFQALDGCRVGDTVNMKVLRSGGNVKSVMIVVDKRESQQGQE